MGYWLILLITGALALVACGGFAESLPPQPATHVDLGTLISDYAANPAKGAVNWKGNLVAVEGEVHSINYQDGLFEQSYAVVLTNGDHRAFVVCVINVGYDDSKIREVASIGKGQRLLVVGEVGRWKPNAMTIAGAVPLYDCDLDDVPRASIDGGSAGMPSSGLPRNVESLSGEVAEPAISPRDDMATLVVGGEAATPRWSPYVRALPTSTPRASVEPLDDHEGPCRGLVRAPSGTAISAQEALCNERMFERAGSTKQEEDAFQTRLAMSGAQSSPTMAPAPVLVDPVEAVRLTPFVASAVELTGLVLYGYQERGGDYVVVMRVEDGTMGCRLDLDDGGWSAVEQGHTVSVVGWTMPDRYRDLDQCRVTAHAP